MYLGIEIGGTKLQLALGPGDGTLVGLWRTRVDPASRAPGIRDAIEAGVPALLATAGVPRDHLRGVGVGFGGPVDLATRSVVKSHQVTGWDGFALGEWCEATIGVPAVVANDAAAAGLAEALFGAGRGVSPLFYVTAGSGVGGALVIDGDIYTGAGRGAAEVGHLPATVGGETATVEAFASGWAIARRAGMASGEDAAAAARRGEPRAKAAVAAAVEALAAGLTQVILLVCPRRVVVGGGVGLMGDDLLFDPLRAAVAGRTFPPFAGLTDIVPAALGEAVVPHGALALAARRFGG